MVRSPRSPPRGEADLDRHQHCRALVTAAWLTRQALHGGALYNHNVDHRWGSNHNHFVGCMTGMNGMVHVGQQN